MSQPKLFQVISRWENVLIETIAISVIIISAAVTANYFGWPSPDPTVKAAAAVYAYGVDGMFYICVRLARHYLSYGFSARGVGLGLFWMLLSALMGAFTWHNNLLFAATSWHISAQALARVGFTDAQELQLHAIIPVAVVLIVAVIPRRHTKEVRTPEQILDEARQQAALLQAQNMLRSVKAEGAGQAVSTSVGGFVNKAFKLDERKAREEAERKTRLERRAQREAMEAEQRQMRLIAGVALLDEFALTDPATGEIDYNYAGLEVRLRSLGKWPPAVVGLDDTDTLQRKAIKAEAEDETEEIDTEEASALTASGKHKVWMTAEDVAKELGIPVSQAALRMQSHYRGRYLPIRSQEFKLKRTGKKIRKAHFEIVGKVKQQEQSKQQSEQESGDQPTVKPKRQPQNKATLQLQDESQEEPA